MNFIDVSDEERAAKTHGRRKHDRISVEVLAAALIGGGGFGWLAFDEFHDERRLRSAILMAFGAVLGALTVGSLARLRRTRDPKFLGTAAASGVTFGLLALVVSPIEATTFVAPAETTPSSRPPTSVAPPPEDQTSTSESSTATTGPDADSQPPEASDSAGPIPSDAVETSEPAETGTLPGTDEVPETSVVMESRNSDTPLSCTVDVSGTEVMPGAACGGRVSVTTFQDPTSGPSAYSLPAGAALVVAPLDPADDLIRIQSFEPVPEDGCLAEASAIRDASSGDAGAWLEQLRMIEFVDAPPGTQVILWADCLDPVAGTGADVSRGGWFVTVLEQPVTN
ncbi:MAG: hypothetical protein KDB40_24470 [Acidimicrobiales bacterium]|nr:hypothetical protein [Acidimicrobiales bacterium]MCB9392575.1 hypothetical protein [Acidimicrobiaceae bacterium]